MGFTDNDLGGSFMVNETWKPFRSTPLNISFSVILQDLRIEILLILTKSSIKARALQKVLH